MKVKLEKKTGFQKMFKEMHIYLHQFTEQKSSYCLKWSMKASKS